MSKKWLSIITAVVLLVSQLTAFAEDASQENASDEAVQTEAAGTESGKAEETPLPMVQFSDTTGHWAADVIGRYAANGYISGYPDGSFHPDDGVSAAEFCKIVSSMQGRTYRVSSGNWAMPYIRSMIDSGVIGRKDFQDFNAKMTREQVAKAVLPLMTGEYYPKDLTQFEQYITDVDDIDAAYEEYVLKTYISGVIAGYEDGSWQPRTEVTRAEILSVLDRVYNKDMREVPEVLGTATESPEKSYYYSAAVQVRNTTNEKTMQYRLYGSDAVYMEDADQATGLKIENEIQGAQGFAMVLRYNLSELKERKDKLKKLSLDVNWAKGGSEGLALGLWYYTYDADQTDWNNPIYYKNVDGSAVAGDDKAGYSSVISNIRATLPTWGSTNMAVAENEKTAPILSAKRENGKYSFDLTEITDDLLSHANENDMVELILTTVNYDGYMVDDDKPHIYIAGEKAPQLNAEYQVEGGSTIDYSGAVITLTPQQAVLDGGMLRLETTDGVDNIADFVEGQTVTYTFQAPAAGTYQLRINYAANTTGGGTARFDVNGTTMEKVFPAGVSWQEYGDADVGTFELKAGENTLKISDAAINEKYLINIRDVSFEYVGE